MLIKIEATAGENIEACFDQAKRIAEILDISVNFDFNGVDCLVNKYGNKVKFLDNYHSAIQLDVKYKYAIS